jgi:hypothetical protein
LLLFQLYLPIEKEEKNGSSARQSKVQYMVLAVSEGLGNVIFVWLLLKAAKNVGVAPNDLVSYLFFPIKKIYRL